MMTPDSLQAIPGFQALVVRDWRLVTRMAAVARPAETMSRLASA
jgi:hypothetical protein